MEMCQDATLPVSEGGRNVCANRSLISFNVETICSFSVERGKTLDSEHITVLVL